jgi:O-antigen chain-terminating methyltransferase
VIDPEARERSAALIERLNVWWRVEGPARADGSLGYRLARPFRRLFARLLGPQETFNATLVQYINSSVRPLEVSLDHSRAALDAALDEARRYREALAARERRMDAAMSALRAGQDELRTSVAAAHQALLELSRRARPDAASAGHAVAGGTDDPLRHRYIGFEDRFRGPSESIRAALADYVPIFDGAGDVLDLGCGRGEFLSLLAERGVSARGVDANAAMVEACRGQGLDASEGDALAYLRALPDASLGGLFAAQLVEHLEPAHLTGLLEAAFEKLRPGAPIVLETINPACWFAFFESYVRDITHVRPLHPETLRFLLVASGFQQVEIRFRAPYPEHEKLQPVALAGDLADAAETLNANSGKLNRLLFTHLDYAAVARRA